MWTNPWFYAVVMLVVTNLVTLVRYMLKKEELEVKLYNEIKDLKDANFVIEFREKVKNNAILILDCCRHAKTAEEATAVADIGIAILTSYSNRTSTNACIEKIAQCLNRAGNEKLLGFLIGITDKIFREQNPGAYPGPNLISIEEALKIEKDGPA